MTPFRDFRPTAMRDTLAHHAAFAPGSWAALLRDAHLQHGDAVALIDGAAGYAAQPTARDEPVRDASWTYTRLLSEAANVASGLRRLGVQQGDRVVLALDNCMEMAVIERALALWGIVRVAVSARLHPREIEFIANDCGAAAVLCEGAIAAALDVRCPIVTPAAASDGVGTTIADLLACDDPAPAFPAIAPADAMSIMYTSGTTGRPKGAINSHRSWHAMACNVRAILPAIGPGDRLLHAAPMSHFSGSVSAAYLISGAAVVTQKRFVPLETIDLVRRLAITCLPLVPTMLNDVVRTLAAPCSGEAASRDDSAPAPMPSLKVVPYGGSNIRVPALKAARRALGNVLVQMYGSSEALIPVTYLGIAEHAADAAGDGSDGSDNSDGGDEDARLATAGIPYPEVAVRLGDPHETPCADIDIDKQRIDEICIRGANVMSGYWNNPAETAKVLSADGWYRSGDLGVRDAHGRIRIVDRKREVIISGGFNVYPAEVERVIATLAGVVEVAVVAMDHERWGEGVKALVVVEKGAGITADDVLRVCKSEMASYKKPLSIDFVDALPKTSTGKIDKRRIRETQAAEGTRATHAAHASPVPPVKQ